MTFLRYLIIAIIILYIIRLLFRVYAPYLIRYVLRKMAQRMEDQMRYNQNAYHNPSMDAESEFYVERDVLLKVKKTDGKQKDKRNIEDADFEEIK